MIKFFPLKKNNKSTDVALTKVKDPEDLWTLSSGCHLAHILGLFLESKETHRLLKLKREIFAYKFSLSILQNENVQTSSQLNNI